MRPMHREVPKDEDSEPEKTIKSATDCTPLAAAPLEWEGLPTANQATRALADEMPIVLLRRVLRSLDIDLGAIY